MNKNNSPYLPFRHLSPNGERNKIICSFFSPSGGD